MRSLRPYLPLACGIRVNAICPWMTDTAVAAGISESWHKAKLPVNHPVDVGKVIVDVTASEGLHGKAMYVEGGRAWEVEDNINRLEPEWLGEEQSKSLAKGQEVLGNVSTLDRTCGCCDTDIRTGNQLDQQAVNWSSMSLSKSLMTRSSRPWPELWSTDLIPYYKVHIEILSWLLCSRYFPGALLQMEKSYVVRLENFKPPKTVRRAAAGR